MDPLLARADRRRRACRLPPQLRRKAVSIAELALGLLFPELADDPRPESAALEHAALRALLDEVVAPGVAESFLAGLPALGVALDEDAAALEAFDPAATCLVEVVAGYPGFLAVAHHRVAHALHAHAPLLARLVSERAHGLTGIDIHPGARIGRGFAIDHGTGVVIGATADIGAGVRLFQGVTLGSLHVSKALSGVKRHPTVHDGVTIYANATILGGETVIGARSVIGANVWLTRSVPADSVVTGARGEQHGAGDTPGPFSRRAEVG